MSTTSNDISPSFLSSNRFNQISQGNDLQSLKKIGEEFEAIFVVQMLKQARDSQLSEGLFDSKAQESYLSLLDQERAREIASKIDFGIADAIARTYSEKS